MIKQLMNALSDLPMRPGRSCQRRRY